MVFKYTREKKKRKVLFNPHALGFFHSKSVCSVIELNSVFVLSKDAERLGDELSLQRMKALSESQRALELERKLFSSERLLKQVTILFFKYYNHIHKSACLEFLCYSLLYCSCVYNSSIHL